MSAQLLRYVAKGDYTAFRKFLSDPKNLKNVDENVLIYIYTTYKGKWVKHLLKNLQPSSKKVGHTLCTYQPQSVINLWASRWGISENIAVSIFKSGSDAAVRKLIRALSHKISVKTEAEMLKRNDVDLLKLWLKKFTRLEWDNEILLGDDPRMSSLLRYYTGT